MLYTIYLSGKDLFSFINKVSNIKVNVDELIKHKILCMLKG
jgi:hypothetical protein